ncbi:MAG: cell division protein FtsQ/DivIB [Candidatus Omnitrophica bacterium]|nr:cell division protein FtsQ/DivIB [Candidatus Omnitrophota bacterium]
MKRFLLTVLAISIFAVFCSPYIRAETQNPLEDLRIDQDEIDDITWYSLKNSHMKYMTLSIAKRDIGKPWLRLYFHYRGNLWIFVNSIIIKADDKMFELRASDVDREPVSDYIKESVSFYVDKKEYEIIKAVISSKRTILRFVGENVSKDGVVDDETKALLQKMLDAFVYLGGNLADYRDASIASPVGNIATIHDKYYYYINDSGATVQILLSKSQAANLNGTPPVTGIKIDKNTKVDTLAKDKRLENTLLLIQALSTINMPDEFDINTIDASNHKNIVCYLKGGIEVRMGGDNYIDKLKALKTVLADSKINKHDLKYMDLRFGNPVIGPK